jgi:hypothetical protein
VIEAWFSYEERVATSGPSHVSNMPTCQPKQMAGIGPAAIEWGNDAYLRPFLSTGTLVAR